MKAIDVGGRFREVAAAVGGGEGAGLLEGGGWDVGIEAVVDHLLAGGGGEVGMGHRSVPGDKPRQRNPARDKANAAEGSDCA